MDDAAEEQERQFRECNRTKVEEFTDVKELLPVSHLRLSSLFKGTATFPRAKIP